MIFDWTGILTAAIRTLPELHRDIVVRTMAIPGTRPRRCFGTETQPVSMFHQQIHLDVRIEWIILTSRLVHGLPKVADGTRVELVWGLLQFFTKRKLENLSIHHRAHQIV
jgi:hypothetical protein